MRFFFARTQSDSIAACTCSVQHLRAQSFVPLALAIALLCGHSHVASATSLASDPSLGVSAETEPQPSALDLADQEEPDANALLDALAHSEDGQTADDLARQIQNRWNASGSEAVDVLMRRATIAMRMQNHILALDLLDTVIALAPDFAEGWNRRATVHFLRDDYALSIADVEQVLRLEPRHFGALSGIGIMLDELGQDRPAQMFLSEALRVHPHLTNAQQRLDEIERRLRGAPI